MATCPNSLNLPHGEMLDPETKTFRDAETLRAAFVAAGLDLQAPAIATCGSGISACVLALGLHLIGHRQIAVYDGSWSEWGAREDAPVATAP